MKRPLSVTLIAWLYIISCIVGLIYHFREFDLRRPFDHGFVLGIRLVGLIAGIYLLRRRNWARWVVIAWMAYHVVLSLAHSVGQTLAHAAFLIVIAWCLLRRDTAAWFRPANPAARASTPAS